MKHLIDYATRPGAHCGSTAMRSLLAFHCGLDLSEAMVAGLGSLVDCLVIERELAGVSFMSFGRGLTMETDCARALGVGYVERPDFDDTRAWEVVRQEVLAGRPTMLSGDTYYLSYHPSSSHFPSHRFVLVGFDDEERTAWIVDRPWVEPRACPYDELAASRNPKDWPVTTFNLWGRFTDPTPQRSLVVAAAQAMKTTAARLLGQDTSQRLLIRAVMRSGDVPITSGIDGIARLRELLLGDLANPEVGRPLAKALSDTFERRGTGGGNFRRLYTRFLEEVSELAPQLVAPAAITAARRSADGWTELSEQLMSFHAGDDSAAADCDSALATIEAAERAMAEALARRVG